MLTKKIIDLRTGIEEVLEWTAEDEAQRQAIIAQESTPQKLIAREIQRIEATMTTRRFREAALGTDGGWFAARDAEIAALRVQM